MSYIGVSYMFDSGILRRRLTACAAMEQTPVPDQWVVLNIWEIITQPGWSEAWASALASDPDSDPGANEAVITDGMILAAVQHIRSKQLEG